MNNIQKENSSKFKLNSERNTKSFKKFDLSERKDDQYWFKRSKNNESARKSRMKRKSINQNMEKKIMYLMAENFQLKLEVATQMKMLNFQKSINEATLKSNDNEITSGQKHYFHRHDVFSDNLLYQQRYASVQGSSESESDEMRNKPIPYRRDQFQRSGSLTSSTASSDNQSSSSMDNTLGGEDRELHAKHYQWMNEKNSYQIKYEPMLPLHYGTDMIQNGTRMLQHPICMPSISSKGELKGDTSVYKKRDEASFYIDKILNIPSTSKAASCQNFQERDQIWMDDESKETSDENQTCIHPKIRIKQKLHSAFSIDD